MKQTLANHFGATLAGVLLLAASAMATLIVPVQMANLADSSDLAVMGVVDRIVHGELLDGSIVTRVSIAVDETWKGSPSPSLELVERGGVVGERGELIYGSPSYEHGEPVVVFAARSHLGWQTNHMLQGKFRIAQDADGKWWALREVGPGVAVAAAASAAWRAAIPLDEVRAAAIRSAIDPAVASGGYSLAPLPLDPPIIREISSEFTTQAGNPRYFEADQGEALTFLFDDRGDSILGLEISRRAVNDAFAAWNAVTGTSLELLDGGLTDDIGRTSAPGVHRIIFDDPQNEIFDPSNCEGTLGIGGSLFTTSEQKSFAGRTYNRILSARVTFADNWDGCAVWTECNFSEIAAHEIGHAFGLGHSSERSPEPDAILREALMYFRAHFDGRCADPREDDRAGIRAVYPDAAPLSVANESPLPPGIMGQPYRVDLVAIAAVPPLTWASIGMGCSNFTDLPGLDLDGDGVIAGTIPNFADNVVDLCFNIELTDSNGDRHAKRLDVTFARATTVPTPSPTAAPTKTMIELPCVGDCNGNGSIAINELIVCVNIALGNVTPETCPSCDANGNGLVAINELVQAVNAALLGCTP